MYKRELYQRELWREAKLIVEGRQDIVRVVSVFVFRMKRWLVQRTWFARGGQSGS